MTEHVGTNLCFPNPNHFSDPEIPNGSCVSPRLPSRRGGEQRIDKSEAAAIAVLTEQVSAGGRIGVVRDLN